MRLHTFKARSVAEALRLVRDELGPDACVLKTRSVGTVWSRWLGSDEFEVTATLECSPHAPREVPRLITGNCDSGLDTRSVTATPPAELHDYRRQLRDHLSCQSATAPSLIERLCSDQAKAAPRTVPIRGPIRLRPGQQTVVALVGPTGVGKTTTIAKLAAYFHLQEQRSVALITADTFRIAAAEQLQAYAEIMDLPLAVAHSARELQAALQRQSECDLILIDTPGASPRDLPRLAALKKHLAAIQPDEVHLVASAVADLPSQHAAARAFSSIGATALVLTKLDEAHSLDWLPELANEHHLPVSYTTSGQNVPDDLQPATSASLAAWNLKP